LGEVHLIRRTHVLKDQVKRTLVGKKGEGCVQMFARSEPTSSLKGTGNTDEEEEAWEAKEKQTTPKKEFCVRCQKRKRTALRGRTTFFGVKLR